MPSSKKTEPTQQDSPDTSQELAVSNVFSRDELYGIESWEQAMTLAVGAYGDVVLIQDTALGDGFKVATEDDKLRLCGVPLLLLNWAFRESDYKTDPYVSIQVIQRTDPSGKVTKWIVNDGSTGIARDLLDFTRKTGRTGGLGVPKGLRFSEYPTDAETGVPLSKAEARQAIVDGRKVGKARTFYLDTSPA